MLRFVKMHGIGNDYVYINTFDPKHRSADEARLDDLQSLAVQIADRHRGVGGDGLILLLPADKGVDAHLRMRMFNADGSESEMCGNGIRCVCKLAHDDGVSRANPMKIQTGAGVLSLRYSLGKDGKVDQVTVDMGEPIWLADDVPVRVEELEDLRSKLHEHFGDLLNYETRNSFEEVRESVTIVTETASRTITFKFVSMGNPHIVFFVDNARRLPLEKLGPMIEYHEAFPRRVNAHFVQVHSPGEVTMRTWERGSGATQACGTGAAAVCAAGAAIGLTGREILAHLPGGDLRLRWDEKSNHVFKTGPATEVFRGEYKE